VICDTIAATIKADRYQLRSHTKNKWQNETGSVEPSPWSLAILQKYKEQYDVEIQQGEVEKDTVDKSIDFLFENACVSFRTLPNIKDSDKEDVIKQAQAALPSWKAMVIQNLTNKGIKVV